MKKYRLSTFFLGLICLLLLSSLIYITPVYGMSTSLKFVGDIAQTPTMSIAESIEKLVTTGKVKNGKLKGVNITKTLEEAGALYIDEDYHEYGLSKFDGVLDLEGTNLQGADFSRLDLQEINLKNADLFNADLSNVNWYKADFSGAKMYWATLNKASLRNVNFQGATLGYSDLLGGDFSNANFKDANMDGVDIRVSNFKGANLENVVIEFDGPQNPQYFGANFTDANFKGATIYIDEEESVYFCRTIMPDGTINNRDCES